MHDRLPPKEMCLWSRDLFKFWEISGSISETAQDRYIVETEDQYRKSYVAYRMASLRVTFSELEGHFCCWKPSCLSATVIYVHDGALVLVE